VRVALISDVHGNLHALDAVLDSIAGDAPDTMWCLGDLVGYGPRPNECCALVAERTELTAPYREWNEKRVRRDRRDPAYTIAYTACRAAHELVPEEPEAVLAGRAEEVEHEVVAEPLVELRRLAADRRDAHGVLEEPAGVAVVALGAAYVGGTSWSRLAAAGWVDEAHDDAVATASAMFTSARAPWCAMTF
jgi:hypothetical protein